MRLFIHCLMKANWKEGSWHGISYKPGQFITSIQSLADETGLSIQQVRTALSHMISTGEITSYQQGRSRIITVNNWDAYQGSNKVSNKEITRCQQDANKMLTADIEYNLAGTSTNTSPFLVFKKGLNYYLSCKKTLDYSRIDRYCNNRRN